MLNVQIQLDRIHCHREGDKGAAEPYLWTVFFYLDINSAFLPGHRMVTITPQSHSTTRNQYANGISAGDNLTIPETIGRFDATLDDGNIGAMVAGVLFLLLEEDETDFDAIRAGHKALEESCDFVLNAYIESKVDADEKSPSGGEVGAISDAISAEVTEAIENAQGPWDYLDNQDDFIGVGFRFLAFDELTALAQSQTPENISAFMATKKDAWSVHGSIQVVDLDPPVGPFQAELTAYLEAVAILSDLRRKVTELRDDLLHAHGATRLRKLAELKHLKGSVMPAAKQAALSAHEMYRERLAALSPETLESLQYRKDLREARRRRLTSTDRRPFRRNVSVVEIRQETKAEQGESPRVR